MNQITRRNLLKSLAAAPLVSALSPAGTGNASDSPADHGSLSLVSWAVRLCHHA